MQFFSIPGKCESCLLLVRIENITTAVSGDRVKIIIFQLDNCSVRFNRPGCEVGQLVFEVALYLHGGVVLDIPKQFYNSGDRLHSPYVIVIVNVHEDFMELGEDHSIRIGIILLLREILYAEFGLE